MKSKALLAGLLVCLSSAVFGQTQLIVNGGFDLMNAGEWQPQPFAAGVLITNGPAADGGAGGYLSMGNIANNAYQVVYQTITFPTNLIAATFSFDYSIVTTDTLGTDLLSIYVLGTNHSVLVSLGSAYNSSPTTNGGYYPVTTNLVTYTGQTNLAPYAGKTVQVYFQVVPDPVYGNLTSFDLDNVSMLIGTTADIPPNDNFSNSITLPTNTFTVTATATNTYASKEPGEPNIAGNAGGHSVWWNWTAPAVGTVTLKTSGSSFSTLVGVYLGSSVNNLALVAASRGQVTFNVTPGTQYQIAVDGYNGQSGTIALGLQFTLDTKPPEVSITSPASGAKVTNSTVVVQGKASDNVAVALVQFRLENAAGTNAYQAAIGTNAWSATVTSLIPGLNTIRVRAFDTSSNVSAQVTRSLTFVVFSPFTLTHTGNGSLSPNLGPLLVVGNPYTLTAKPATGSVFSNWTGGIFATTPVLKFYMTSNLVLQANFIPNPFIPVKGSYAGLFFDTNNLSITNAGLFTATLTDKGGLSAKLQLAGKTYSLSGSLSLTGYYSNSVPRKPQTPLSVQLQVDLSGGNVLTGWISAGSWMTPLMAYRAVYSRTNPPAEALKHYTLAVLPGDPDLGQPGGYGFGTVSVDALGNVSFAGTLGDGAKVSQKTFVSQDHQWPLYLSLYSGKGAMFGWLSFTNGEPDSDVGGWVYWSKSAPSSGKLYRNGFAFTNGLDVAGSLYQFTNGVPVLNLTNANSGLVILEGGNLAQTITNGFMLDASNKVTGTNKLNLKITTSSGLFQGSVLNPANGKSVSVSGAILEKQNGGWGVFAGTNQTGSVYLGQ